MKKLIAISVMCALIAGAAFAETEVFGVLFVGGAFLSDNNKEPADGNYVQNKAIGLDDGNSFIGVKFGDAAAGGKFRVKADGSWDMWYGWWRPIEQLRVQIGANPDGDFGTAQISGWGFTGENKNNGGNQGALSEYAGLGLSSLSTSRVGFYGGTGATQNIQFSVFPIDGLTVNFWIPFNNSQAAGFTYARFHAQVKYAIEGIGTAFLSYQSDTGYVRGTDPSWWGVNDVKTMPKLFASFYLTAVENMAFDLGFAYEIPWTNKGKEKDILDLNGDKVGTEKVSETAKDLEIGLGYRLTMGDFGFKLRAGFLFGGYEKYDGKVTKTSENSAITKVGVNILPSYNINSNLIVYFYAGLGIQSVKDYKKTTGIFVTNESNSVADWFINPFIFIRAGDSLRFKTGFQLYSNGVEAKLHHADKVSDYAPVVNWAIPFGFYSYF